MPFACTAVRVLIASPSDVGEERKAARIALGEWNEQRGSSTTVIFLPLMWELHAVPEQGERPQGIVNKQLVAQADVLVAIFWTRLGTPTGVAESGTAEEIKEFRAAGKHVAVYFSTRANSPYDHDATEFARLKEFREWCRGEGLIDEFSDLKSLSEKLMRLLDRLALQIHSSGGAAARPTLAEKDVALREEFARYMARAAAAWEVERDSDVHKLDDAKRLIRGIGENLIRVATSLVDQKTIDLEAVKSLAKEARMIEQHQLYMDGGQSYQAFWKIGDGIVERASGLLRP